MPKNATNKQTNERENVFIVFIIFPMQDLTSVHLNSTVRAWKHTKLCSDLHKCRNKCINASIMHPFVCLNVILFKYAILSCLKKLFVIL